MAKLEAEPKRPSGAVLLVTPLWFARAMQRRGTARRTVADANASITPGARYIGRVMVFAAIALARPLVVAATVAAPAVCMDPADTGTAMCGVTGVPIMDLWFLYNAHRRLRVAAARAR